MPSMFRLRHCSRGVAPTIPKRARLLATLAATSRSLSDADLETAVELVGALGRRRKR
jgi:hypothetical protein